MMSDGKVPVNKSFTWLRSINSSWNQFHSFSTKIPELRRISSFSWTSYRGWTDLSFSNWKSRHPYHALRQRKLCQWFPFNVGSTEWATTASANTCSWSSSLPKYLLFIAFIILFSRWNLPRQFYCFRSFTQVGMKNIFGQWFIIQLMIIWSTHNKIFTKTCTKSIKRWQFLFWRPTTPAILHHSSKCIDNSTFLFWLLLNIGFYCIVGSLLFTVLYGSWPCGMNFEFLNYII